VRRAVSVGYLAGLFLLGSVYLVAGKFGLTLASVHVSASPVWPPTGIALASLLLLGFRYWPAIFAGAFLVNLTTAGTVATSLGIAAGNTLEAVCGAWLVRRFAGGPRVFDRPQDTFKFVALAGLLSTALSPTLGITSLALGGFAPWSEYGPIWLTWWLGDVGGALLVAPVLILWGIDPRVRFGRARVLEAGALVAGLVLVSLVVFAGLFGAELSRRALTFLCVPLVIWPAFRFGQRETATACFILSAIAVWGTLRGYGPFLLGTPNEALVLLQAFMSVTAMMALPLAAVVAEWRRAQQAIEQQAAELARSNAELEQFAYVASHDLQEPLRMITGFVQLLERRYRDRLDQDAGDFIRYAVDGASRMRDLIHDVLAFARAGATGRAPAPTDCGRALDQAIANLGLAIDESGAVITREDLPTVLADRLQVVQVFQNLLGNAIKFRGERRPEVHVGVERQGSEWVFRVRDNGIGIEPAYTGRIFNVFQRLHGRDRYPGTGIGLAVCKRIIARHGGRIWVESDPGAGSTFYFTLPVAQETAA
jgi:signal transduction histidine kinase